MLILNQISLFLKANSRELIESPLADKAKVYFRGGGSREKIEKGKLFIISRVRLSAFQQCAICV
jgi:hypothetical protein